MKIYNIFGSWFFESIDMEPVYIKCYMYITCLMKSQVDFDKDALSAQGKLHKQK
jgi:hypothetical protein